MELLRKLDGHTDIITRVAWSPDGSKLASSSFGKTIRIWDNRGITNDIFSGHQKGVTALSWSPDSKMYPICDALFSQISLGKWPHPATSFCNTLCVIY